MFTQYVIDSCVETRLLIQGFGAVFLNLETHFHERLPATSFGEKSRAICVSWNVDGGIRHQIRNSRATLFNILPQGGVNHLKLNGDFL